MFHHRQHGVGRALTASTGHIHYLTRFAFYGEFTQAREVCLELPSEKTSYDYLCENPGKCSAFGLHLSSTFLHWAADVR